jgi:hypothetical protein
VKIASVPSVARRSRNVREIRSFESRTKRAMNHAHKKIDRLEDHSDLLPTNPKQIFESGGAGFSPPQTWNLRAIEWGSDSGWALRPGQAGTMHLRATGARALARFSVRELGEWERK